MPTTSITTSPLTQPYMTIAAYSAKPKAADQLFASPRQIVDQVNLSSQAKQALASSETAKEIMFRYDFTHISYTDLVKAGNELRDAGLLPAEDYLDFIGISPEFARIDGTRNPNWNQPRDMIGLHGQLLDSLRGEEQRFIDFEKHLLNLFKNFQNYRPISSSFSR